MTLQVDIVFTDRALTTAPALQQLRLRLDQYQPRSSPLPGLPTAMFWQTGDLVKLQGVPLQHPLAVAGRIWTVMEDETTLGIVLDMPEDTAAFGG
jgi:hypothetical protein